MSIVEASAAVAAAADESGSGLVSSSNGSGSSSSFCSPVPMHLDSKQRFKRMKSSASTSSLKLLRSILYTEYKRESEIMRDRFSHVASIDKLIAEFRCAMRKDILRHGVLYLTKRQLFFYTVFGLSGPVRLEIDLRDVKNVRSASTAKFIPNAIKVLMENGEEYTFTSFTKRDAVLDVIREVWRLNRRDEELSDDRSVALIKRWFKVGADVASLNGDFSGRNSPANAHFESEEEAVTFDTGESDVEEQTAATLRRRNTAGAPDDSQLSENEDGESKENLLTMVATNGQGDASGSVAAEDDDGMNANNMTKHVRSAAEWCQMHQHLNDESINEIFDMNIDELFRVFTLDTEIRRTFFSYMKCSDVQFDKDFPMLSGELNADISRRAEYSIPLNYAVGPNRCSVTEIQTLKAGSRAGRYYLIERTFRQYGFPYASHFSPHCQYCLVSVGESQCRLLVTHGITVREGMNRLFKSIILRATVSQSIECHLKLKDLLLKHCNNTTVLSAGPSVSGQREASSVATVGAAASISEEHRALSIDTSASQSARRRFHPPIATASSQQLFPSKSIFDRIFTTQNLIVFSIVILLFWNILMLRRLLEIENFQLTQQTDIHALLRESIDNVRRIKEKIDKNPANKFD